MKKGDLGMAKHFFKNVWKQGMRFYYPVSVI